MYLRRFPHSREGREFKLARMIISSPFKVFGSARLSPSRVLGVPAPSMLLEVRVSELLKYNPLQAAPGADDPESRASVFEGLGDLG